MFKAHVHPHCDRHLDKQTTSITTHLELTGCITTEYQIAWYEGKSKPTPCHWKHHCNSVPSTIQQVAASCSTRTCTQLYVGSGKAEHKSRWNQASLVLLLISRLCVTWEHANGKVYRLRNQSHLLHGICPHTDLRKAFSFPSLLTNCICWSVLPFSLVSQHTGTIFSDFFLFLSKRL